MGRGKAKAKKHTAVANQDDPGSGEEEKIPAQKRRGRPQKPIKDEINEDEVQKIEDDDSEDTSGIPTKDTKNKAESQIGKRRKKIEKAETVKEEKKNETKSVDDEVKVNICSNGIRPNRSRRKSTPRRAAEAVVECN